MNGDWIELELMRRGVFVERFSHGGNPAVRFLMNSGLWWNAIMPIDDESDAKFVDFVMSGYIGANGFPVAPDFLSGIYGIVCSGCGNVASDFGCSLSGNYCKSPSFMYSPRQVQIRRRLSMHIFPK